MTRADLEGALCFVRDAGELERDEPFPRLLLDRLVLLVRCRGASYCELDVTRHQVLFLTGTDEDEVPAEAFWETAHDNPIKNYRRRTGELHAVKTYDFVTPRQLRQTQFYADFIRPWATPFMMTLGLPAPAGQTRTFIFDREDHDFGERERSLLDLLQPHLVHIHRSTELRRRAPSLFAGANGTLTARETEILSWVAKGLPNREIAAVLWISPGTVRRHLDNIYAKLGVHTRTAAVRIARDHASLVDRTNESSRESPGTATSRRGPGF